MTIVTDESIINTKSYYDFISSTINKTPLQPKKY